MTDIIFILIGILAVLRVTQGGFLGRLSVAIGLFVSVPAEVRLELPGGLPELTLHRVILLVLLILWPRGESATVQGRKVPLLGILWLLLATRAVSVLLSISPGSSLKDWLSILMESALFYQLAARSIRDVTERMRVLRAVVLALSIVAVIALVERYADYSLPVAWVAHFHYCADGIQSTYSHRILLGYAMAMGMPLALLLLDKAPTKKEQFRYWGIALLLASTCYLADSRGGWIGMLIATVMSAAMGSRQTRQRCLRIGVLVAITLIVRPGIRETIMNRIDDTFADGSYKATSYSYRWKLWHVAFSEICRSPDRLLLGYGGQSTESMDLSRYFESQQGGTASKIGFTSWDNHYASDLIEFGLLGLGLEMILYLGIVVHIFRKWRQATGLTRELMAALLAASVVYLFARSNVYIFSAQLKFLFWTLAALGCGADRLRRIPATRGTQPREVELEAAELVSA